MKMNQPIGNELYGPLLVRCALGLYFILAGYVKYQDIDGFVTVVHDFGILPSQLATVYAILLPYIEMGAGILLVFGMWTTLAAILTSLMLVSFIIALGPFPHKGSLTSDIFNKDIVLLACSISLLFTGGGSLSVDHFRKTG